MVTTLPKNTTVLRDAILSLKCTTDANPDAHIYHFYLNDNLIGNSSSGVFNTTVMEDGVYTCVPINTDGTGDNATVSITAVGKCKHISCPLFKETICKMLHVIVSVSTIVGTQLIYSAFLNMCIPQHACIFRVATKYVYCQRFLKKQNNTHESTCQIL